MNEQRKYISLILFSKRGPQFVVSLRGRWRDIYSEGGIFLSHTFFRDPGGTSACTPLHHIVRDDLTPLIGCVSLARLFILCTLSKFARVVLITRSPSGYTPVGPDCPDALLCLLITKRQLVKAHGVTRNEPKIYVICYITRR